MVGILYLNTAKNRFPSLCFFNFIDIVDRSSRECLSFWKLFLLLLLNVECQRKSNCAFLHRFPSKTPNKEKKNWHDICCHLICFSRLKLHYTLNWPNVWSHQMNRSKCVSLMILFFIFFAFATYNIANKYFNFLPEHGLLIFLML